MRHSCLHMHMQCFCLIVCVVCQVQEAAERSVASKLRCQVAAGQQKFERQAAQNSSCLSEANAELQVGRLHWTTTTSDLRQS